MTWKRGRHAVGLQTQAAAQVCLCRAVSLRRRLWSHRGMLPRLIAVRFRAARSMKRTYQKNRAKANVLDYAGVADWPTTHKTEGVGGCYMGQDVPVQDSVQADP